MKVKEIVELMDKWAPFELAESFDNVGLLVGDENEKVSGILIALDVTLDVIAEAKELGANLIVTHHPVVFFSMKELTTQSSQGIVAMELIKSGISVISAHTNLDIADGGVNTALVEMLELDNHRKVDGLPFFIVGDLQKTMTATEFARYAAKKIGTKRIIAAGSAPDEIKTVCVLAGAGGGYVEDAKKVNADVYFTGNAKHSNAIEAGAMGVYMMCAGHYETEVIVLPKILAYLQKHANVVQSIGTINISMSGKNPFDIMV